MVVNIIVIYQQKSRPSRPQHMHQLQLQLRHTAAAEPPELSMRRFISRGALVALLVCLVTKQQSGQASQPNGSQLLLRTLRAYLEYSPFVDKGI